MEEKLTPLLKQYREIKSRYPDYILMFRLGDFYEMFFDDADTASKTLSLFLTARQGTPMCGVPHHSADSYISRLIKAGHKVAICEQLEEASDKTKLLKRDVVRIVTPGTTVSDSYLLSNKNNYLMSLYMDPACLPGKEGKKKGGEIPVLGFAYADVSTGEINVRTMKNFHPEKLFSSFSREYFSILPREIIFPEGLKETEYGTFLSSECASTSALNDYEFDYHSSEQRVMDYYKIGSLKGIGPELNTAALCAVGGLLSYISGIYAKTEWKLDFPKIINESDYLYIDRAAYYSLDIINNETDPDLLSVIDFTKTPMGARLLKKWVMSPLLNRRDIEKRHGLVEIFHSDDYFRKELGTRLSGIIDIERFLARLSISQINPREIVSLKRTLEDIYALKNLLESGTGGHSLLSAEENRTALSEIELIDLSVLKEFIEQALADEPATELKEGGIIRDGFSSDLDVMRAQKDETKQKLSDFEQEERTRTGISNLKVGYTSVFGYYIELSKANAKKAPPDYIRKQTLTNAERFTVPKLKEYEEFITGLEDRIKKLEYSLFLSVREKILSYSRDLRKNAAAAAYLDTLFSFAECARRYNYVRPKITDESIIKIKDLRHPVVERMPKMEFIPNDIFMDGSSRKIIIITGPNMAGKSTYIRQIALAVILAQAGSFVPAASCEFGLLSKIFTRIGAQDNLYRGVSTFMVEMEEAANIANNADGNSLVILDEIGRGTSTYDGLSIAWALIEYLHKKNVKTAFATHYFELTHLASQLSGVVNMHIPVREWKDRLVFLHKIAEGKTSKSYGIEVGRLAGLPDGVTNRAREILSGIEKNEIDLDSLSGKNNTQEYLPLFDRKENRVKEMLKDTDVNRITPLEAINLLSKIKEEIQNED